MKGIMVMMLEVLTVMEMMIINTMKTIKDWIMVMMLKVLTVMKMLMINTMKII